MDHTPQGRRPHPHRGRRGQERRNTERRNPPSPEQPARHDRVDVEQIMRDIRSRISQTQGIDLSVQEIEELAARRLEAVLDPQNVKPALLEALRKQAGTPAGQTAVSSPEPPYSFEDSTLYDSHRGLMRTVRRILNPLLKLFFNPNPLIRALNIQARLNAEALAREAERERRQAEWNALHFTLVQRVVTETARVSIELQHLALRVESLAARVDFNDRRVRGIEGSVPQARTPRAEPRPTDPASASTTATAPGAAFVSEAPSATPQADGSGSEATRRRRRRRRGRRGGTIGVDGSPGAPGTLDADDTGAEGSDDGPDDPQSEGAETAPERPVVSAAVPPLRLVEPPAAPQIPTAPPDAHDAAPDTPSGSPSES